MPEVLCTICSIRASRVLRRTEAGIVTVPEGAVRPGHIMVVSVAHAASFADMTPAESGAFMALVASAARAAEQASGAERYYAVRIGDQTPHVHFHLVPRMEGDPPLAPFVFGGDGWSAHIRSSAAPAGTDFERDFISRMKA